jgi:hypothetical protein
MAEKMGFADPEDDSLCFGLCESHDGATIQRPLLPDREVLSVMETWFDKPAARFVFQIKLFTEQLVNSKDPKIVQMMFIQAVYMVICGLYPTAEKDVVALAAMQFQAKFGNFNRDSHRAGFLSAFIAEYVPADHLNSGAQTVEAWENLCVEKCRAHFRRAPAPARAYSRDPQRTRSPRRQNLSQARVFDDDDAARVVPRLLAQARVLRQHVFCRPPKVRPQFAQETLPRRVAPRHSAPARAQDPR